jgi:hypothetical protein
MSSRNKKKIRPPQDLAETTTDGQVVVYSELIPWLPRHNNNNNNNNNEINLFKKVLIFLELQSLAHVTNTNSSSVVTAAVKSQVHSVDIYIYIYIHILEIRYTYERTIFLIYHFVTKSLLPK